MAWHLQALSWVKAVVCTANNKAVPQRHTHRQEGALAGGCTTPATQSPALAW